MIDELMGHQADSAAATFAERDRRHYWHTNPEMAARAVQVIQQRLVVVLEVAELAFERHPNWSTLRVF